MSLHVIRASRDHRRRLGVTGDNWDPGNEGLSIWAAYEPDLAATFAASLLDQSGNANDAGDPGGVNTPDWATGAADGWIFNAAASEYLTTTFVPAQDQSQSMIIKFSNYSGGGYLVGSRFGAARNFELRADAGNVYYWNGSLQAVAPTIASGTLAIAGTQGYRNGAAEGAAIGAYAGPNVFGVYIACENSSGAAQNHATAKIQRLYIYDVILTAGQIAAIHAAIA